MLLGVLPAELSCHQTLFQYDTLQLVDSTEITKNFSLRIIFLFTPLPHPSEIQHQNSAAVLSLPVCSNNTDTNAPVIGTVDIREVGICKGEAGCLGEARIGGVEGNEKKKEG
jgi:hypothetical protein